MQFLAAADMTQLPAECIAELLAAMEQVDAGQAAVRGQAVSILAARQMYTEFGHRAPTPFLIHWTRVKYGKAVQVAKLGRLHRQHPLLAAALAEQDVVSESIAVQIAAWTGKLPEDCIPFADGILIEVHPNPAVAKSDAEQALTFADFEQIADDLSRIPLIADGDTNE